MRKIYVRDGASFVWQWQPKEHIVLEGYPDGVFVRYANCDTVEAPVVQTRREGDKLIADIPPELMMTDKDITVYVCNESGIIHCHFLSVVGTPKPDSYIYEPVEVLRYDTLAERIRLIEEWIAAGGFSPGGGITEETDPTVADWAKAGQPEPYGPKNMPPYPVSSVNGKSGAVQLGAADVGARPDNWMPTAQEVGALPADTKIPAKTSDLSNDSGFITKSVVDLVNYYTKQQTEDLIAQIPKFRILVVQQLPAVGEELVLYLVPFATAEGQYLEYIWTGGRFEVIGSQKVDLTGYATEEWVQAGYQPKGEYLLATALGAAIDTALAEAKASGLFDGDDGRGIKSIARTSGNGAAGTTDTYTITYTDGTKSTYQVRNGTNGTNGSPGDDGITPHIGSNGNWYIGSTDTGIKAQGEQGPKGDTGATGPQGPKGATGPKGDTGATGAQGPKGDDGADGKTPIKGTDYWTPADQESIVQQVITALETPVFGRVDTDNNIILTGELADGVYAVKYEDTEGNVIDIGEISLLAETVVVLAWTRGTKYNDTGLASNDDHFHISQTFPLDANAQYVVAPYSGNRFSVRAIYYDAAGNFLARVKLNSESYAGDANDDTVDIVGPFTIDNTSFAGAASFALNAYCPSNNPNFVTRVQMTCVRR